MEYRQNQFHFIVQYLNFRYAFLQFKKYFLISMKDEKKKMQKEMIVKINHNVPNLRSNISLFLSYETLLFPYYTVSKSLLCIIKIITVFQNCYYITYKTLHILLLFFFLINLYPTAKHKSIRSILFRSFSYSPKANVKCQIYRIYPSDFCRNG